MQRFGFTRYGDPHVFTTIDAPVPVPKPDQVQLQVLGFGLNPYDASWRNGDQAAYRQAKWPVVPGTDVVGRITALGENVHDFAVGDVVINYRPQGGYSEYVTASVTKIVKKPMALSFLDAAALPQVGISAYTIFHQLLDVSPGTTVAIIGASGGLGAVLVQLAKYEKLPVIAVASQPNQGYLTQLGADVALTYEAAATPQWAEQAEIVINAVNAGHDRGLSLHLIRSHGTLITTAFVDVDTATKPGVTHLQLGDRKPPATSDALNYLVTMAQTFGLTVRVAEQLAFHLGWRDPWP